MDNKLYKWRLVFKGHRSSFGSSLETKYDFNSGMHFVEPSNKFPDFHDFVGTYKDCDNEWDKWREQGFWIQDAYNLGEFKK